MHIIMDTRIPTLAISSRALSVFLAAFCANTAVALHLKMPSGVSHSHDTINEMEGDLDAMNLGAEANVPRSLSGDLRDLRNTAPVGDGSASGSNRRVHVSSSSSSHSQDAMSLCVAGLQGLSFSGPSASSIRPGSGHHVVPLGFVDWAPLGMLVRFGCDTGHSSAALFEIESLLSIGQGKIFQPGRDFLLHSVISVPTAVTASFESFGISTSPLSADYGNYWAKRTAILEWLHRDGAARSLGITKVVFVDGGGNFDESSDVMVLQQACDVNVGLVVGPTALSSIRGAMQVLRVFSNIRMLTGSVQGQDAATRMKFEVFDATANPQHPSYQTMPDLSNMQISK